MTVVGLRYWIALVDCVGLRWMCTAHGTALQRLEREREYLETMWEKAEQDVDRVEHNHEQLSAVQASLSVQQQSAATSLNAVMESFRKEVHKVQQKQARLTEQRRGLASNQTKMQERLDEHYLALVERRTDVAEARRVRRYDDAAVLQWVLQVVLQLVLHCIALLHWYCSWYCACTCSRGRPTFTTTGCHGGRLLLCVWFGRLF